MSANWFDRSWAADAHREDRGLAEPPPSPFEDVSVDEPGRELAENEAAAEGSWATHYVGDDCPGGHQQESE